MAIVYCATNTLSGKKYIGLSKQTLPHRKKGHRHHAKKGRKSPFYDAWRSYGEEVFVWEVLYEHDDINVIVEKEESYIKELNTLVPHGYNLLAGRLLPPNMKGIPKSAEHRRKISEANKGKVRSAEYRKKISDGLKGHVPWNKGLTIDDPRVLENVRKSALSKRGKSYPKISAAKKGKPTWNKGIPRTEECKRKISESRRGKKYTIAPSCLIRE